MQENPLDVDFKDGNRFFQKLEVKFKVAIDFLIIGSNFPFSSPKFVQNFSIYLSSNDWKKNNKKIINKLSKENLSPKFWKCIAEFFLNKFLLIFSRKYVEIVEIDDFDIQERKQFEIMKENVF